MYNKHKFQKDQNDQTAKAAKNGQLNWMNDWLTSQPSGRPAPWQTNQTNHTTSKFIEVLSKWIEFLCVCAVCMQKTGNIFNTCSYYFVDFFWWHYKRINTHLQKQQLNSIQSNYWNNHKKRHIHTLINVVGGILQTY